MKHIQDKLIAYLENQLPSDQRREIETALTESEELRIELEELKTILNGLEVAPEFQPSHQLQNGFDQYLAKAIEEDNEDLKEGKTIPIWSKYRTIIQLAAACVILLLGIGIGTFLNQDNERLVSVEEEMKEMRTAMLQLIEHESVSQRIKGVNVSYNLPKHVLSGVEGADNEIIQVIIKTMNEDESSNVRLAALEALTRWADQPMVKDALIEALLTQKDPAFQITLINTLVEIKEKRALPNMQNLINDEETLDYIKGETQVGIFKLESI